MLQLSVSPDKKLSTVTYIFIIGSGLIFGVFLSLFIFSSNRQNHINSFLSFFGQNVPKEEVENPVLVLVPSIHVDPWVGNSLPSVTVTNVPHTTIPATTITMHPTVTVTATPVVSTATTSTPTPSSTPVTTSTPTASTTNYNTKHFTRKVLLIYVDPLVNCPYKSNQSMRLHECMDWNDPKVLAPQVANFFKDNTNSHVNFTIVEEYTKNEFTEWGNGCFSTEYWNQCSAAGNCSRATRCTNGFTYTPSEYFACIDDSTRGKCLSGETNMRKMMNNYGVPGKVNSGAIDEVWLYGAPWMSMWESQAIGPRAFSINSPPIMDFSYNRTTVMMPMSYERDLGTSIHNFGHRFEATMGQTYHGWAQNRTSHNWDRFGLVKAQSPNYSYSGCGSTHYPPNALSDYDYGNKSNVVATTCDTFYSYPDLSLYGQSKVNVTCTTWGCTEAGYFAWWVKHFPRFKGVGSDERANDWWYYLLDLDNVYKIASEVTSNQ